MKIDPETEISKIMDTQQFSVIFFKKGLLTLRENVTFCEKVNKC